MEKCVCACACARARACVCACVCVRVRVRACACVHLHVMLVPKEVEEPVRHQDTQLVSQRVPALIRLRVRIGKGMCGVCDNMWVGVGGVSECGTWQNTWSVANETKNGRVTNGREWECDRWEE